MMRNTKQKNAEHFLNHIDIASPCQANWADMAGDEQSRFCSQCNKNVYSLSTLTSEQAQALIMEKEGKLCIRFYQREDGTMLTQDCPRGLQALRLKMIQKTTAIAAAVMTFILFTLTGKSFAAVDDTSGSIVKMGEPKLSEPSSQAIMGEFAPPMENKGNTMIGQPLMGEPTMKSIIKPVTTPDSINTTDAKKPCCKPKKCKVHRKAKMDSEK